MFKIFNSDIKESKSIAFAGVCKHIGTTTQALQLLLYLKSKGKKVCYIEMNTNKFIYNIQKLYQGVVYDDRLFCFKYRDIKFFKKEFYYKLRQENFDYIIKDYGVYEGEDFEKYSFLEQDIKIVVGGIKANEIFLLEKVLKDRSYKMYYILNFVPQYEKACVEDLFLDEKERVFFSPIILDMFDLYVKNDNFKFIIGI